MEEHNDAHAEGHDGDGEFGGDESARQAEHGDPHGGLGGDVGDADGGHAPLEGGVELFVLDGVAAFMSGDAESGDGGAVVIFFGENEAAVGGVVVVGEVPGGGVDGDVADVIEVQNALGDLGASHAGGGGHLGVFVVGGADAVAGEGADGHGADEEDEVEEHGSRG